MALSWQARRVRSRRACLAYGTAAAVGRRRQGHRILRQEQPLAASRLAARANFFT